MPVNPIPKGYEGVTPYLIVDGAARALEFYRDAFGAVEVMRMPGPGGKIGHAEFRIRDAHVMIADEHPEWGQKGPTTYGGSAVTLMVYVPDVDQVFAQALKAGATKVREVEDQFYGDRAGSLRDPFGHVWHLATHVEDVADDELRRRAAKAMEAMG